MFMKKFGLIALILCVFLIIGYFAVNTGAVSTVLLAIQGAITDGNLVKFSGTNGIGVDTGLSATNVVKCKFDATSAPTVNNDVGEGYTVGSRWLDVTDDKSYVCLDNTNGVAVWTETTGGGTVITSGTPVIYDYARFTDATTIEGRSYTEVKSDLGIDLSLYYLKTEVDTQGEVETIWGVTLSTDAERNALTYSDVGAEQADAGLTSLAGLTYVSPSFIKVTATDTYAIRTYAEVKDDLDLVIGTDVLAQQTIGIANDNLVEIDDTDAAVDDYCKLTANGIVGRSYSEVKTDLGIDLTLYYLKTEIDTLSEVETIYAVDIIDSTELAALEFADLTDTPANYTGSSLKFVRVNEGETALEFAAEADPTVDTDAEIKAILVDEVIKTGDFTAGRITKINNSTGIIEQGTNTDTDVADAVTKKHAQNTDTTLILTNALGSDHTYSGLTDTQPVGESVVFGDLLYFNWAIVTGTDIAFVDGGAGEDTITQVAAKFLEIGLVAGDIITVSGTTNNNGNHTIVSVVAGTINVATGTLVAEGAGASVTIISPYEWKKAKADASTTVPGLRIALETKANGEACLMLVKGYIRDDSAFDFAGAMVYVSAATAGAMTSTAPSATGNQLQRVGQAKSADILFFDPSQDVGEI